MSGIVTVRAKPGAWARLAGAAALAGATPAIAQTTLAQNPSSNTSFAQRFEGQSFTVAGSGAYTNIGFSFQNGSGSNVGAGNLYFFTSAYTGTPSALASSNPYAVAAFSNGSYNFGASTTISANSTYYAYSDALVNVAASNLDPYAGGDAYTSNGNSTAFIVRPGYDFRFNVTGTQVSGAPEPASWGLMIGGFGVAGGALRRRQRGVPKRGGATLATG